MDPNRVPDEGSGDSSSAAKAGGASDVSSQTGTGRWVESSWDLCRGLTVREGLPADAGLDEWLEAMLRS